MPGWLRRGTSRRGCALEAALLGRREGGRPGGHELVEEDGQLGCGLELDPLPEPDLRDGRASLRLFEVDGRRLEPAGDGGQPLGERGVVAGEQEEEAVPDRVQGERAPLPDPQDLRVEDGPTDVVELELALESADGDSSAGSIASTCARCARSSAISASTASRPPSPSRSSASWMPSQVPSTGSRSTMRRKRASTRS